jgi:hypothetical protein
LVVFIRPDIPESALEGQAQSGLWGLAWPLRQSTQLPFRDTLYITVVPGFYE